MTNTPMTFEEWAEENMHAIDDMVYAKQIWQASQAQQAQEIEFIKCDLFSYMKASNEYVNEIMKQAQVIAELVKALEHYENDVTYDDDILGLRVIKSGEVARQALAKVKGK